MNTSQSTQYYFKRKVLEKVQDRFQKLLGLQGQYLKGVGEEQRKSFIRWRLAALHCQVALPLNQGEYFSFKSRWDNKVCLYTKDL